MQPKLFMLLLGCKPQGRFTEQHDIYFDIGPRLSALKDNIRRSWPEGGDKLHIDAWREVTAVNSFAVEIAERQDNPGPRPAGHRLFFINLGGYKPDEFEEYHYKMLVTAPDKGTAFRQAKATAFYQHTGFKGAESHIDDKYGVDVDDLYEIQDILPPQIKEKYSIRLTPGARIADDPIELGYLRLDRL